LRQLAFHDPLTLLANRSLFRNRVEHALALAHRSQQLVAVMFLDLTISRTSTIRSVMPPATDSCRRRRNA
jgi:predicted signal transduction protein with EAL and GGDEF domain